MCEGDVEDDDAVGDMSINPEQKILLTRDDSAKQINPDLDPYLRENVLNMLWSHIHVFAQHDLDLGLCRSVEPYKIDMGNAWPI